MAVELLEECLVAVEVGSFVSNNQSTWPSPWSPAVFHFWTLHGASECKQQRKFQRPDKRQMQKRSIRFHCIFHVFPWTSLERCAFQVTGWLQQKCDSFWSIERHRRPAMHKIRTIVEYKLNTFLTINNTHRIYSANELSIDESPKYENVKWKEEHYTINGVWSKKLRFKRVLSFVTMISPSVSLIPAATRHPTAAAA